MTARTFQTDGESEVVVMTRRDYDALLARAGDDAAEDAMAGRIVRVAIERRDAEGDAALPEWLSLAILAGEHPIRASRKRKGMSLVDLARATGIGRDLLADVESGGTEIDAGALASIARSLDVEVAWIED